LKEIKIFSGRSHPELAEAVCQELGVPLSSLRIEKYKNGCFEVILEDDVRDKIVFLIQTSLPDSCDLHCGIWELSQTIDAALKSGAKEIVVIMPYVSYARSDKSYVPGMTISGKLLIRIFEHLGMKRFIGINFHSSNFKEFFSSETKVHSLYAEPLVVEELKKKNLKNAILLPGDEGAFIKARYIAKQLNIPIGYVEKKRISDSKIKIETIRGEVANKDIIIFDDEVSTGGTTKTLIKEVLRRGANENFIIALIHGPFTRKAINNLRSIKGLEEIIVTDTVPISKRARRSLPLKIFSVNKLLAEEIKKISKEDQKGERIGNRRINLLSDKTIL